MSIKINKEILRLAIPNIISNISIPLLSTVDTALMGRLSEYHLGAVGIGAMIFNFIYWNFGFLRMGTTGITAQAFGRNDNAEMMQTLSRGICIAIIIVALLLLFQKPVGEFSFYLMNVSTRHYDLVSAYFYIRIWAAPASIALFAFMGWFFGMQNAIIPLILTIFINVINIFCSYIFVNHYNMGVEGVAWGTVIAQYAGFILAIVIFMVRYSHLIPVFSIKETLAGKALSKYLSINRDIFFRTICLTFVFAFFYSQSSKYGDLILAVNVVLLQFVNWMSYGIDGFAYASESLVGRFKGAQENTALNRVIKLSFIWGMVLAIFYGILYFVLGDALTEIFTDKQNVIAGVGEYLLWIILFPLVSSACYIWDGVFIGLTATKEMMQSMFLAVIVFALSFVLLQGKFGNHGLWAAMLVFMAARGMVQWFFYRRYLRVDGETF